MERFEYFKFFHNISLADYELLTQNLKTKILRKGDLLTAPGQIQKELYFVKNGVQMSYFEAPNKSHVIAFTYFPNLCAMPESFSLQMPSRYYLSCLTDSELEYLTYDELQKLLTNLKR